MFGIGGKKGPPSSAGRTGALKLFEGFATLTLDEKRAVAELIVQLAPSLAAHEGDVKRLPMAKIIDVIKRAGMAAWVGIMQPQKLLIDLGRALEEDPAGDELRKFCREVSGRISVDGVAAHASDGQ